MVGLGVASNVGTWVAYKTQDESLESLLATRRAKLFFGDQATKDESLGFLLTTRRAKLGFGDGRTTNP